MIFFKSMPITHSHNLRKIYTSRANALAVTGS